MTLDYRKLFDPAKVASALKGATSGFGDRSGGAAYVYGDDLILAVNVAMAAGRPLLVRGPSGVGKSSLARAVSSALGYAYYEIVVNSRTEPQDFLWRVDHVRRLRDANFNNNRVEDMRAYTTPGPLFWAFDADLARILLTDTARSHLIPADDFAGAPGAVVLIDEIDKAEPDVPNGLLEAIGLMHFRVEDLNLVVTASKPAVIIITTNEERDLPPAFLRRCVEVAIKPPDAERLARIGASHFPKIPAPQLAALADAAWRRAGTIDSAPSAAEYLDVVRACDRLGCWPGSAAFELVLEATIAKR